MTFIEFLQTLIPPKIVEVVREVPVEKIVEKPVYIDRLVIPTMAWDKIIPEESMEDCVKRLNSDTGSMCDFIRALEFHLFQRIKMVDRGNEVWKAETAWKKMQGDCTERSLIAVEMLRIKGIKAKVILGYSLENDGTKFTHARVRIEDPVDCEPSGVLHFEYDPNLKMGERVVG